MKAFLVKNYRKFMDWLFCEPELDPEQFEKLESKKYPKQGGTNGN